MKKLGHTQGSETEHAPAQSSEGSMDGQGVNNQEANDATMPVIDVDDDEDARKAKWTSYAQALVSKHVNLVVCEKDTTLTQLSNDLMGTKVGREQLHQKQNVIAVYDEKIDGEADSRPRTRLPPHSSQSLKKKVQVINWEDLSPLS